MAGRPRRIEVDSRSYLWKVDRHEAERVRLRIWIEGRKSAPWIELHICSNDFWLHFKEAAALGTLTAAQSFRFEPPRPRHVARIIRWAEQQATTASTNPLAFDPGTAGNLRAVDLQAS